MEALEGGSISLPWAETLLTTSRLTINVRPRTRKRMSITKRASLCKRSSHQGISADRTNANAMQLWCNLYVYLNAHLNSKFFFHAVDRYVFTSMIHATLTQFEAMLIVLSEWERMLFHLIIYFHYYIHINLLRVRVFNNNHSRGSIFFIAIILFIYYVRFVYTYNRLH